MKNALEPQQSDYRGIPEPRALTSPSTPFTTLPEMGHNYDQNNMSGERLQVKTCVFSYHFLSLRKNFELKSTSLFPLVFFQVANIIISLKVTTESFDLYLSDQNIRSRSFKGFLF